MFRLLQEQPLLGRDFDTLDDRPGAAPVAVLTAGVWRSRYGADASIVGRVIRVNGTPTTVIGVMREPLRFPNVADIWCPLSAMPGAATERRAARILSVAARLADGASLAGVRTSLVHAVRGAHAALSGRERRHHADRAADQRSLQRPAH